MKVDILLILLVTGVAMWAQAAEAVASKTSSVQEHEGACSPKCGKHQACVYTKCIDIEKNVATKKEGATCKSSSDHSKKTPCENTMNGKLKEGEGSEWYANKQGQGAWIQFTFPKNETIEYIQVYPGCLETHQCSELEITFDNNVTFKQHRKCNGPAKGKADCSKVPEETYPIKTSKDATSTVKIECSKPCDKGNFSFGYREVKVIAAIKVDECKEKVSPCDKNAVCTDLPIGYNCTCKEKYEGDGLTCHKVDECKQKVSPCDKNAVCTDLPTGYNCTCKENYEGDGLTCHKPNPSINHSVCKWVGGWAGSHIRCPHGYTGVGLCGSQASASCGFMWYHALKCCKLKGEVGNHLRDCDYRGGYDGDHVTCPKDHVVDGSCGTGMLPLCSHAGVPYYAIAKCCDTVLKTTTECKWWYGDSAARIQCNEGEYLQGICGSGFNAKCEHGEFTGIHCCKYTQ